MKNWYNFRHVASKGSCAVPETRETSFMLHMFKMAIAPETTLAQVLRGGAQHPMLSNLQIKKRGILLTAVHIRHAWITRCNPRLYERDFDPPHSIQIMNAHQS